MSTAGNSSENGAVLDAFSVLAWLRGEAGAGEVRKWLEAAAAGRSRLFLSVIDAGEVYSRMVRVGREAQADLFWRELQRGALPVRVMPVPVRRVRQAAEIKGRYALAYADAFAAQLALELRLPLITGDPEFRELEREGFLKVYWLPSG